MVTHQCKRDIFPFFELPRELRNMVYTHLGHSLSIKQCWVSATTGQLAPEQTGVMKVGIDHATRTNLLCVSHQFEQEYAQQLSKQTTVVFTDHKKQYSWLPRELGDAKFRRLKHVAYYGHVFCEECSEGEECTAVEDVRTTNDRINTHLARLSDTINLKIYLSFRWGENEQRRWPNSPHDTALQGAIEQLGEIRQVSEVQVYGGVNARPRNARASILRENLYVSWMRGSGWRAPEENAKGCKDDEGAAQVEAAVREV